MKQSDDYLMSFGPDLEVERKDDSSVLIKMRMVNKVYGHYYRIADAQRLGEELSRLRCDRIEAMTQRDAALKRVVELENEVAGLREEASASSTFGVARRFQDKGPKAEQSLRTCTWLELRLEQLAELERQGEEVDAKITNLAHQYGWVGGMSVIDWLEIRLRELNAHRLRLDKLRDVLVQEQ